MSDPWALYDTWYTFQSSTTFYLSWSRPVLTYAYLYGVAKDMWFENVIISPPKDSMFTGDQVNILERISGFRHHLWQPSSDDYTRWGANLGTWQLWNDLAHTPGQLIYLGQPLYVTSVDSGLGLAQYPGDPQYLTVRSDLLLTFRILPEADTKAGDDEADDKTPPKFAK